MASRQVPKGNHRTPTRAEIRALTTAIRKELANLDVLASGTLHHRTKVCGKPTCKCASDPTLRHGPYFEWGRTRNGKLVQSTVSPEQAKVLERAIANHQRARALLLEWERLTEKLLLDPESVREA
jgi:hypothetical protein